MDPLAKHTASFSPGSYVFRQGDPGDDMFVIQSGTVRIVKEGHGETKILGELGPGDFFGEMAIVNGKPRGASAQAVTQVAVVRVDAKRFEAMISHNAEIAVRLIHKLAGRLEAADSLIGVLMENDPKTRVVLGLLREAEALGRTETDGSVTIPFGAKVLAEQWNLTTDEAHDTLNRLARLGIIESTESETRITSMARLGEFEAFLRQT